LTGFDPAELLQSSHGIVPDVRQAEFPLRMISRFLVVEGDIGSGNGRSTKLPVETGSPVVLEYEIESGLFNPCWTSIGPDDASGLWKLQVIPTGERPMALLLLVGLPLVWGNVGWTGSKAADFTFQSPSYMKSIVHSVRVRPA
jgi:hypothetical protein